MDQVDFNIKGFSALQEYLKQLPAKVEANVMAGALRAGAKVILNEAKQMCPTGQPSGRGARRYKLYEGALRDSIKISVKRKKGATGGTINAYIRAGGKAKNGAYVFYAHVVEYTGAIAHRIPLTGSAKLNIAGYTYASAQHPGMNKRPFMRPALDGKAGAAIQATGEYIKKRLQTKEGIDTSGITIEVQE